MIVSPQALQDLTYWVKVKPRMAVRALELIELTRRHPFNGPGKPEPLRHHMRGAWSRRIDDEHRLVYRITGSGDAQTLEIAACRYHYSR
ncbi:Txe/YoeB family addiction module toxin [Roseitalea sp. MMSF_3504]|uniref:Txe/YoeB family addiction module toxin n=1 Tax=Roseitalea sp. MMSF_3504 TaxID=3046716 RepID=UPI00273EFF94|nr:Txe/YoeB family addiction module toxin [Roseitalea sp. MMSF_3504]